MSNAYDNPHKRNVREEISSVINKHFEDEQNFITMMDLLGEGVGAEFYLNNIDNLGALILIERNTSNYYQFKNNSLHKLKKEHQDNIVIEAIHTNLLNFLEEGFTFSILNLDFCGIFKTQCATKYNSNVLPVEIALRNECIEDNGLMFLTYKIGGWYPAGWDSSDDILQDPNDISKYIVDLSTKNGYSATEIHRHVYKSQEGKRGQASDMLSIGFKMKLKEAE